jgi:hypothetical protein
LQKMNCRGAEGRADCRLTISTDDAGELCICEIDAGDEKDAEDGGKQEPEARGGATDEDLFHGLDVGGEGAFDGAVQLVGGDLVSDVVVDCVEVVGGLGDGDAGFQAAKCDVVAVVAVPSEVFVGVNGKRGDDLVVG